MDYFTILHLDREPFSNSPNPDFFFQSRQHMDCLQKLELAVRLKRGLNIVIGAVGSGKTTLCRTLLKKLSGDTAIESHLILDPAFNTPVAFLEEICAMIVGKACPESDAHRLKEHIKHHLFKKGVDDRKSVIVLIDEAQKLPLFCLEILREFLNYETNDHKLLQIVLFAQEELQEILDRHANLADRVNLIHRLGPMSLADTSRMIHFRIRQASSQPRQPDLFTRPALRAIYRASGGYPRKIINLCHQCMLALIVQNRSRVNWRLVRTCSDRSLAQHRGHQKKSGRLFIPTLAVLAVTVMLYVFAPGGLQSVLRSVGGSDLAAMPQKELLAQPDAVQASQPEIPVDHFRQHPAGRPAVAPAQPIDRMAAGDKPTASPSAVSVDTHSAAPIGPEPVHAAAATDPRTDKASAVKSPPPSLIGALRVKQNDTLGEMIKVVYGDFRSRYLEALLDANPHIGHADAIRVGDTIAFPAIPARMVKRSYPLWWLKVGDSESLEAAYRRAIKTSENNDGPTMRIISQWSHLSGIKYGIYVFGYFFNPSAAEAMRAELPAGLSGSAEIISGWPADTILYCDPLVGRGY
ncbi:AAA family ATPase [Desulfosarcina sp.]|uniref:AAA family ATPase n=1 Tax=Desulfosarcina sp. TaxID=2027861 RepID=UPI003970CA93